MSGGSRRNGAAIEQGRFATRLFEQPPVADSLYVCNTTRQSFLSLNMKRADSSFQRLRGWLGRMRLRTDEGLWIVPSQGIHTIGVLFPIDVIYLDARLRVIHLIEHLGPLRIGPLRLRSNSVLELPPRTIYSSNTQIGDHLLICSPEAMVEYWNARRAAG